MTMASYQAFKTIISRSLSTSAVKDQLVKAPIQVFGVEGRYASALYSAASKQKQLDAVEKDLDQLKKIFATDETLREFLLNPVINKKLKSSAVKGIASKLSLSSCSTNLLDVLAENGRLKKLPNVADAFKTLMAATRGEVNVEVTSAKELDSAYKKELEGTLQKFVKKGETLQIKYKLDTSIMGGLIVSIGDRFVDLSTSNKVKKYTALLKGTV